MKRLSFVAGVENVGGDMFKCVPQGDAIFIKVRLGPSGIFFLY